MRVVRLNSRSVRDVLWPLLDDDIQACRELPYESEDEFRQVRVGTTGEPTSWLLMSEVERAEIRPQRRLRLVSSSDFVPVDNSGLGDEAEGSAA